MSSAPAALGSQPGTPNVTLRLPGAVHDVAHGRSGDVEGSNQEQVPLPPRVHYDPGKVRANLQSAIEHLNKQLASSGRSLGFSMDSVINYPVVTVRSTQTGEVIRQIPSEAVIRVAHTLDELKGLLHDAIT